MGKAIGMVARMRRLQDPNHENTWVGSKLQMNLTKQL